MPTWTREMRRRWREELFQKQDGLCHYCRKPMSLTARKANGYPARNFATFEHLIRIVDGGKTDDENVVLAHRHCNSVANIEAQRKDKKMKKKQKAPWYQPSA